MSNRRHAGLLVLGMATVLAAVPGARAQAPGAVEKMSDGAMVSTPQGVVRLTVRTASVIHVQYARDKTSFSHPTVSVVPHEGPQEAVQVTSDGEHAIVSTTRLKAEVDLKSGRVTFLAASGKPILAEKDRSMEPATVQGESTNHIRQQWEADPAESLYGMGEMQLGITNIKDWDLDFWQHNGTTVVPFLVSSKGYGLFWDNTSYTRFGDLGEFESIPADCLVDDAGTPGGISSGSVANSDAPLQNPRTVPAISLGAGGNGRGFGRGRGGAGGGTRWEGHILPKVTGDYQFRAYSSGTLRTWIDGKLVMDHYRQNWLPWYDVDRIHLEAGKQVAIKIDWRPDGNNFQFAWKPPVDRSAVGTSLWSEVGDGIDYYFCYGPSIDKVISGFRDITGKANMLPNWAFGYWQSRDHYSTQQQSIDAVKTFRDRQIPLDNIVQDWQYWPGQSLDTVGSWAFNNNYPDPVAWTKAIHEQHAHLMISVWGWISSQSQPNTNYQQMLAKHYLLGTAPGGRTFTDFFNPGAGKLFWQQLNGELFNKGIDAWWLDGSEPDIAGTPTLDAMRSLMNPNGMGTGARMLNTYPLLESKYVYEGQRAAAPGQRVFILTRSGFPGMQRYSASVWSGDSTSTWPAMRQQIMAGLGYSISGMPYWTMDIGGYQTPPAFSNIAQGRRAGADPALVDEWDELNTRWFEFGTFAPLMRVHGQGAREIYNFGPAAQEAMIKHDRLRYALMPYLYSLAGSVTRQDDTIMRPLVMDFPTDARALAVDDQYMFGPALMVSPVYTYKARTRAVYLPNAAGWYAFWTGRPASPGTTIEADAPFDALPLFVRAGSIIPTGPVQQYVGEKAPEDLTLYVYTGANGAFTLYEDEGVNYNYEHGASAEIPMTWDEASRTLTLGRRTGTFPGMLAERNFNVVFVSKDKPVGFALDARVGQPVHYKGDAVRVKP